MNPADYRPAVNAVLEYVAAEMDAATPAVVIAYCETNSGEVVELTLSDLVSVTHVAAEVTRDAR